MLGAVVCCQLLVRIGALPTRQSDGGAGALWHVAVESQLQVSQAGRHSRHAVCSKQSSLT